MIDLNQVTEAVCHATSNSLIILDVGTAPGALSSSLPVSLFPFTVKKNMLARAHVRRSQPFTVVLLETLSNLNWRRSQKDWRTYHAEPLPFH